MCTIRNHIHTGNLSKWDHTLIMYYYTHLKKGRKWQKAGFSCTFSHVSISNTDLEVLAGSVHWDFLLFLRYFSQNVKKKISDLMVGFPGLSSRQKPFTCCCRSPASHAVSSPRPTAPAAVPSPAAVRNSGTPEKPAEPWWHAFPLSQSAPSLPRQRAGPEPQLLQPEKINKNKKTGGMRELIFSMHYIQYVHVWAWNWIHQISKEKVSALKISRK